MRAVRPDADPTFLDRMPTLLPSTSTTSPRTSSSASLGTPSRRKARNSGSSYQRTMLSSPVGSVLRRSDLSSSPPTGPQGRRCLAGMRRMRASMQTRRQGESWRCESNTQVSLHAPPPLHALQTLTDIARLRDTIPIHDPSRADHAY